MERRGGGRNNFFGFGDPFTGFGGGRDDLFGFGDPFAGFGGFGRPGSLISSFFGGRNPFDDPFFTRPFGYLMGPSMFDPRPGILGDTGNTGFIEQAPPPSKPKGPGPVIKELNSDDEEDDEEEKIDEDKKDNPRKRSRSSEEPEVQHPVEETEGE